MAPEDNPADDIPTPGGSPEEEGYPSGYDWTDRKTILMAGKNLAHLGSAMTMKALRAEYWRLREDKITVNGVEMSLLEAKKMIEELTS